jgi:energy-coupling factor transporter ATP-binding protein EcfA2
MGQPDYRGARGSNAGDDFHELWALRQALVLLDSEADLAAITVEGLRAEDEEGKPLDTWDGVDCTLYYGGDRAAANRIVIAQLKYSAANPDQPWTVARLTHSTNKKQDNSVIGRLAKAFAGLKDKRPELVASGKVVVRLVSNQPIDSAVLTPLSQLNTSSALTALFTSSGLQELDFEAFTKALDLSELGRGSRFGLEERVLASISEWTDDDARATLDHLMRFVRRTMMPEAKGEVITRESILLCFGFSDPGALFPCPSTINRVDRVIPREASQIVAARMKHGDQRICLYGGGGSGKTTALQEIEGLLPSESVVIVFDCYGNGRYLDSDAYRHRPTDAFLQLSNDLARKLRMPLLLSRSGIFDYPRAFKKRLERAAELVGSRHQEALLVIIVDAADNSIMAASTRSPPEKSFVHDFVALGDLPVNVRFVVTARTGRLETLELPPGFKLTEIKGFDRAETAANVRGAWNDAPDTWIEDFHQLSSGNPRVQQYALKYAGTEVVRALDYLRPYGKGLDQVFREQLEYALHKEGHDQDIKALCAGLVALSRPVPLGDLSAITNLTIANLRDLCADLAPGVRLIADLVSFADEDFEHFVRTEAEPLLFSTQVRIANYFISHHKSDAYAATHVAAALLAARRGQEIIDLVNTEQEPKAISDPVLRRNVQLQRLQIAMKVCREAANNVDAMLTLLIGAEALRPRTLSAVRSLRIQISPLPLHGSPPVG